MGAINLQSVGPAEAPLLAALHGECFDLPWSAADFASLLAAPGAAAHLASNGTEPLGFLLTRRAADEAEIITTATRPFARRRGVAAALLAVAMRELAGAGITRLFLEVAAGNDGARAFYRAQGFTEVGQRRGYYERDAGAREDAIVMVRKIKP